MNQPEKKALIEERRQLQARLKEINWAMNHGGKGNRRTRRNQA